MHTIYSTLLFKDTHIAISCTSLQSKYQFLEAQENVDPQGKRKAGRPRTHPMRVNTVYKADLLVSADYYTLHSVAVREHFALASTERLLRLPAGQWIAHKLDDNRYVWLLAEESNTIQLEHTERVKLAIAAEGMPPPFLAK